MRRIVKLKGEMIISLIISIILAWIIICVFDNIVESKKSYSQKYGYAYNHCYYEIDNLKNNFEKTKCDKKTDSDISEFLLNSIKDREVVYLTDNAGNIIWCNQVNITGLIDVSKEDYSNINIDGKQYNCTSQISLTDDRKAVLIQNGYIGDDFSLFILTAVIIAVIFLLLISGRIKYINILSRAVNNIKDGDLSVRAPVKYKNELTSLAECINSMTEEIEKQDLKEKEFITNISHDLRTPLTAIIGYVDMIKQNKYDSREELDKYINIIGKKSRYLQNMLEDFFYYSKVRSDDIKKESLRINLNQIVFQMLDDEEEHFKECELNLSTDICRTNLYTVGDPMLIHRCFQNLISNALKYAKKGTTVNIIFTEKNRDNKNYALFKITNIPETEISKEDVFKLFDRMYKADKSRSKKGSGLGLSITKEIVKNYKGFTKAYLEESNICFEIGFIAEQ